ncbi:Z1 domain-containing protein [Intrasporangium calvum]|uniref:Z1 domain-containing protein n=1 Tax=Intrasporangium calvum TaxID=53358 RepID=A0ABT5GDG0_9MICO|nr:Z1 domain-containing protein [Intrasporangium calvum]MDC5696314.1 Z1 domain-containing protein [Intrasporangium calvum]
MSGSIQEVRSMVLVRLDAAKQSSDEITTDLIHEWVHKVAKLLGADGQNNSDELEQLVRDLEADYNVYVGNWTSLADDGDHVKWLEERRPEIKWAFWDRYQRFMREHQQLPSASVKSVAETTDDILGRLEAPNRPGAWDRRGLVAGQVQSGKTGNYTGLVAKALDSGYKLVVVLAGVHNSLRSQTQARIDEGILGFDTRKNLRFDQTEGSSLIGVGRFGGRFLPVNSFTSSKETGDFSLAVAKNIGVVVGGNDPIVLVVKKHRSILTNLYEWATALRKETNPETGRPIVRGVPVLVIDDEADYASVDTNGPKRGQDPKEVDPTTINGLIRKFLDTFEQSAYVAYTATPYANIFISPDKQHRVAGEDLFPRSFIVSLPAPSSYIGPARVFGVQDDGSAAREHIDSLPIVRHVADYDAWLPDGHKADVTLQGDLPGSLREAILSFLIGGAVRSLRGQGAKHNSMLIHVTRYTNVQRQVADQVKATLEDYTDRLQYGEGNNPALRTAAHALFTSDHLPTTRELLGTEDVAELVSELPDFESVWAEMATVAARTRVHTVNGTSQDALEYVDHPDGLSVIAIGGDKLSRGLTLEGLSVSYYLRASKMYDTLMQMGRWFGYRPGYLDVCRLYTTAHLTRWYVAITAAAAELQSEFEAMAAIGRTPEQYGLRVRQHPDGLLVTSPSKLRHSTSLKISYSATISETISFAKSAAKDNWSQLERLLGALGPAPRATAGLRVWRHVPPDPVISFVKDYVPDKAAIQTQPKALIDYIQSRLADGELTTWTVALADVSSKEATVEDIAGLRIGLTRRAPLEVSLDRYTVRRVGSPRHEIVDLDKNTDLWNDLLRQTVRAWNESTRKNKSESAPSVPGGLFERLSRPADKGLLILYPLDPDPARVRLTGDGDHPSAIVDPREVLETPLVGFAISFPASDRAQPISYQVNKVFWEQEYGSYGGEDDEDGV